ncbi:hypothetical protein [Hymenobacter rigui]|uniref:Outer membrane protein beta-barrel domain-containing protein n=1 Tax=Hymenobacter rigui TaxID=334424 RepID=A0A3R9MTF8_9BACT|nr:hypothetical protein [Hymenobacter rigui]RSK48074.1 hypothetical protein EI291_13380 [Hymenobacter rigui]
MGWIGNGVHTGLPLALCLLVNQTCAQAPEPAAGPFYLTLHVAGGTGLVALGGGYRLARQRLEPELLVGYVPRRLSGSKPLAIFTLKTTYLPWSPRLGQSRWQATPVTLGAMINYTTGQQFFLTNNSAGNYRPGYYWWSSAVRLGLLAGTRVNYGGPHQQSTTAYAELSTNDLHLVSRLTNRSLRLVDILTLGGGLKRGF